MFGRLLILSAVSFHGVSVWLEIYMKLEIIKCKKRIKIYWTISIKNRYFEWIGRKKSQYIQSKSYGYKVKL